MGIKSTVLGLASATSALVWLVQVTGCTSDNSSDGAAGTAGASGSTSTAGASGSTSTAGASGSTSTAGASGSTSTAGAGGSSGSTATACTAPTVIPAAKPGIADFESYDGATPFKTWSFSFGGDASNGVLAGTFSYGDRPSGFPEVSEVAGPGNAASKYAMRIADSDPNRAAGSSGLYGGGMGLWLSTCLNATAFSGISFWVRGNAPKGTSTLSIAMKETMTNKPADPMAKTGTCTGDSTTCINPKYDFPVTTDWTQVKAPWSGFVAGDAAGTPVTPDGRNITQLQIDIGLSFQPTTDGGTVYAAVPAPYELVIDDVAFY